MKSFKEYLVESKKIYKFKIKVVGDCPKDCAEKIKLALSEYSVASVGTAKTTPISANHKDFPEHKNVAMSVFDATTHYPATSEQILNKVAQGLGMSPGSVKVLNEKEQEATRAEVLEKRRQMREAKLNENRPVENLENLAKEAEKRDAMFEQKNVESSVLKAVDDALHDNYHIR